MISGFKCVTQKLINQHASLVNNQIPENLPYCEMPKQSNDEEVPTGEICKRSTTQIFSAYEVEMSDSHIHKLTSEMEKQSIGEGVVICFIPNCSTHEDGATSSMPIQSTSEEVHACVV